MSIARRTDTPAGGAPAVPDRAATPAPGTEVSAAALGSDRPTSLPPLMTLGLFVAGIILGVAVFTALNPPPPPSPYGAIPSVTEPKLGADIARELMAGDARALAGMLQPTVLEQLAPAISPVVEVTDVRFLDAVSGYGDTLAGYFVRGRTATGETTGVGYVLRFRDGEVIAVS